MSFYNDASLVFLPSGGAGKDGKAYSIKPVPEYGTELITNGSFDTDSDWTFTNVGGNNGWRIADGRAICDTASPSSGRNLNSSTSLVSGKSYKVTLDILQSADELEILVGSTLIQNAFSIGTTIGASYIIDSSQHSGGTFSFYGGSSDLQEIDNVSVREVTVGDGDFTFSRGSNLTATRVDSNGLIEKGRENLLLQSNQFDTTWNDGGDYTITSGQNGYDGTTDAWLLQKNTTGNDYLSQSSLSTDAVNTISFYAKEGSVRGVKLVCGGQNVAIDLRDGSTISTGGASGLITAGADLVSGTTDWYRVNLTRSIATSSALIKPTDENGADVSGSIYIQDAQLEQGLVATEYIESGASTGKAGILEGSPRFDYSGGASCPILLLEPSRSSLFKYSEYFDNGVYNIVNSFTIATNSINSPEGVQNASLFTSANATNEQYLNVNSLTVANGSNYTLSVFAKKKDFDFIQLKFTGAGGRFSAAGVWFNISTGAVATQSSGVSGSIEDYGNGWYRCIATATATGDGGAVTRVQLASADNTDNVTGNGSNGTYFFGGQFEEGSYPTSYIPNNSGGSVTRAADYSESSTSLSIGDSEFCAYYEMDAKAIPREGSTTFFRIEFGSNSHFIGLKGSSDNINNMYTLQTSGNYSETLANITEAEGVVKFLINYSSGTGNLFINGTTYAGVITGPATGNIIDNIELRGSGYSHDSKQILLFPEALSTADCEILTGATAYESFSAMATALNYTTYE